MDVDGVLTDCGMYYTETGDEIKKFNTYDGMGIEILRKSGVKTAIMTSENTNIVKTRAAKLGIDYLFQGVSDKLETASTLCASIGVDIFSEVAFIGDDINDKSLLEAVSIKACPASARSIVKAIDGILVLDSRGGEGAVRDFVEHILSLEACHV